MENVVYCAKSLKAQYQIEKALINDRLHLSKVSWQFRIPDIYNLSWQFRIPPIYNLFIISYLPVKFVNF